ncbi:MAG: hypothetical protein JSW39_17975 [Desulfobacterales bacterium]|nr:MAG: hypothetical protein JSW39_17975 [Desulfobacterales bacterium]
MVIIRYLPTKDGLNVDETVTGWHSTLDDLKTRIDTTQIRIKYMLEEGSRYHGYRNSAAIPSLGYRVVYIVTVYEEVQPGFPVPWSPGWYRPDYNQILTRFNAEAFVNDLDVKEFWLWTWHYGGIEPAESNMSSPVTGEISNSERYSDDLPFTAALSPEIGRLTASTRNRFYPAPIHTGLRRVPAALPDHDIVVVADIRKVLPTSVRIFHVGTTVISGIIVGCVVKKACLRRFEPSDVELADVDINAGREVYRLPLVGGGAGVQNRCDQITSG